MEPGRLAVQQPGSGEADDRIAAIEGAAWKQRPFARTFDLLSSQYGWTDDQILDLTMARMRQAREVIWERQAEENRRDLSVREIELRTLASYIAGAAGHKQGVKDAGKIRLLPAEVDPDTGKKVTRPIPYSKAVAWFGKPGAVPEMTPGR